MGSESANLLKFPTLDGKPKANRGAKPMEPLRFVHLAHKLLESGAIYDYPTIKHKITSGCQTPVPRSFSANITIDDSVGLCAPGAGLKYIDMEVPCRKCDHCLQRRAKQWQRRAMRELATPHRTWLATFTVAPEHRVRWAYSLNVTLSVPLSDDEFRAMWGQMSKELTKYFKRMRKAGHKFRYLLVAEGHKDGFPHAHALIHETHGPVTKRELESEWKFGYTSFKLADRAPGTARYVTKYVAKDARARVRASLRYGETALGHSSVSCVIPEGSPATRSTRPPQTNEEAREEGRLYYAELFEQREKDQPRAADFQAEPSDAVSAPAG